MRSQFQQSFWDGVPQDGTEALKINKVLGYRFIPCADKIICECFECLKAKVLADTSVKCGNKALDPHDHVWDYLSDLFDSHRARAKAELAEEC